LVDLFKYMMMHGLTNPKFIYINRVTSFCDVMID
jgi:hypothetical protein